MYNEIVGAVENIVGDLFEQTGNEEGYRLYVVSDGYHTNIKFLGVDIWHSEDDDREWSEATENYEPLEPYLRRKINEELDKLMKVRV